MKRFRERQTRRRMAKAYAILQRLNDEVIAPRAERRRFWRDIYAGRIQLEGKEDG